jgi:tetratricopeptide (TPR) repeat protein
LWHEFCHVVTLEKTKNKMPRWLSEGISVYEERQANPAWGQTMTAQYRKMILSGELLPVSRLSAAFLQPPSPLHLQFAYYESSLVVEYLVEQHGLDTLKLILHDLAQDVPINAALEQRVGSLDVLDEDFAKFARQRAHSLAKDADWEVSDLPSNASVPTLRTWTAEHPDNLVGLQLLAAALIRDEAWEEAKQPLRELLRLYPEDISDECAYRKLARVHRELGETDAERAVLTQLSALDADAVDVYRRMIEICEANDDWAGVAENAEYLLAVNPLLRAPHQQLARAAEQLGTPTRAIQSYRALVRMDPVDPAEAHFRLARLLRDQGEMSAARRQVLMALEEAPRYRAAQRLLLELVDGPRAQPKPAVPPKQEETQ